MQLADLVAVFRPHPDLGARSSVVQIDDRRDRVVEPAARGVVDADRVATALLRLAVDLDGQALEPRRIFAVVEFGGTTNSQRYLGSTRRLAP